MSYKNVVLDYRNRELTQEIVSFYPGTPQMSESESAFISGLIKEFKPRKIVEIGVHSGASSILMINSLEDCHYDYEMWSLDLAECFPEDTNLNIGFLIDEYKKKKSLKGKHFLRLGYPSLSWLKDLGENIDLLVLDTIHYLPGEILDFLAIYPLLSKRAVVVLHDVVLNHYADTKLFATKLLFDVIKADKYYNLLDDLTGSVLNIAAFRLNDTSKSSIIDVISSLSISWGYKLNPLETAKYSQVFKEKYSSLEYLTWQNALNLNQFDRGIQAMDIKYKGFIWFQLYALKGWNYLIANGIKKTLKRLLNIFDGI
jgi:predicted O-methyltransferase YrrM